MNIAYSENSNNIKVFLVAKWADGSFLRLPADWKGNGEIAINPSDWLNQNPRPNFNRRSAALHSITIHKRVDSVEYAVNVSNKIGDLIKLSSDREVHNLRNINTVSQHQERIINIQNEGSSELLTSDIESALFALILKIDNAISGQYLMLDQHTKMVQDISILVTSIKNSIDGVIETRLTNGQKFTSPISISNILRDLVDDMITSTSTFENGNAFQEYASLLKLEDCHRKLKNGLGIYITEVVGYKESISFSDEMKNVLDFYPGFGACSNRKGETLRNSKTNIEYCNDDDLHIAISLVRRKIKLQTTSKVIDTGNLINSGKTHLQSHQSNRN